MIAAEGDRGGRVALYYATFEGTIDDVKALLLDAGADPDVVNDRGDSPRDWAERIANFDVRQHLPPRQ